ncbi:hypothetical protein BN80_128 [Yersinia phage phiR1-RT]|uniref:Uncharacterized protein n=1 Tax=Yersinia phage phiR1-RT TaxID=1206558 RepID=I7LEM0_BPPR1|nr:hypothetical protein BN80_128 [Yersinia phage phiR1-RT]CCI88702.1 hypothetical protein BN80_128 [Yersinia phage phiR1-RT]
MSRSTELMAKASELTKLFGEVIKLAEQNNYGIEVDTDDGTLEFKDWLSSSCYGEADEGFGTLENGSIWESSSC